MFHETYFWYFRQESLARTWWSLWNQNAPPCTAKTCLQKNLVHILILRKQDRNTWCWITGVCIFFYLTSLSFDTLEEMKWNEIYFLIAVLSFEMNLPNLKERLKISERMVEISFMKRCKISFGPVDLFMDQGFLWWLQSLQIQLVRKRKSFGWGYPCNRESVFPEKGIFCLC